jgi:uncharacterized protein DUF6232
MTLYYQGPQCRITDEAFELIGTGNQRFLIRDLRHVHLVGPSPVQELASSGPVRIFTSGTAGAAGVAVLGSTLMDGPGPTLAALAVFAIALIPALVARAARRQPTEVRAIHRGRLVRLYSTSDRRVLGQVTRALSRVLERSEHYDSHRHPARPDHRNPGRGCVKELR